MSLSVNRLVWVDLETVGLLPNTGQILEVGIKVTDRNLREISQRSWVVHLENEYLAAMDEWGLTHHGGNGLLAECRKAKDKANIIEHSILSWLNNPFALDLPMASVIADAGAQT